MTNVISETKTTFTVELSEAVLRDLLKIVEDAKNDTKGGVGNFLRIESQWFPVKFVINYPKDDSVQESLGYELKERYCESHPVRGQTAAEKNMANFKARNIPWRSRTTTRKCESLGSTAYWKVEGELVNLYRDHLCFIGFDVIEWGVTDETLRKFIILRFGNKLDEQEEVINQLVDDFRSLEEEHKSDDLS